MNHSQPQLIRTEQGPEASRKAGVEVLRLGTHYVLHNQIGGAVVLANPYAAQLWEELEGGAVTDRAVQALAGSWGIDREATHQQIQSILDDWQSAGLFSADRASPRAPPAGGISIAWASSKTYQVGDARVCLRCDDGVVGDVLQRVLHTLECDDLTTETVSVCIADGAYWVSSRASHQGPYDFAVARHLALRDVICVGSAPEETSAVLHAGAVRVDDRAILIAGDSGFGKSTLIAGLVLSGCPYIADDLIGLNRREAKVRSFPVALSLKPGSYDTLKQLIAAKQDLTLAGPDDFGLHYLDATVRASEVSETAVSKLVFPNFQAACQRLQIRPVSPLEALQMLLATGTRVAGERPTMAPLVKLLNETPAVELTYSDWREAAAHLTQGRPS